jgi:hypothetical protein
MIHGCVYTVVLDKAYIARLTGSLHRKAHLSEVARRRACSMTAATWLRGRGGVQIPIHALIHVLDVDLEAGNRPRDGLHFHDLTGLRAINRIIACSLTCNRNLAYDEGTRLDCCDVAATTGDYDMAIITLGRLYYILSCQLAPTNALSMQHDRHAGQWSHRCLGQVTPFIRSGLESHLGQALDVLLV